MTISKRHFYLAIYSAISILLYALTGQTWGFILINIALAASLIKLPGKILNSITARTLMGFLAITSAYQLEAVFFNLTRIQVASTWYIILTFIITAALWSIIKTNDKSINDSKFKNPFTKYDLILILPAIIITGLYSVRIMLPGERDDITIVRSITGASDDIAHLSMFDALLRSDSNLLSFSVDNPDMAMKQQGYPMGWHLSASVLTSSIDPTNDNNQLIRTAQYYYGVKLASFFLVILALTILIWQVTVSFKIKSDTIFPVLGLYSLVAFTTFLLVLPQFFLGFLSFLAVFFYLCVFLSILIGYYDNKSIPSKTKDLLLTLCIASSAFSWILTAPVLLAAYTMSIYQRYLKIRNIPWYQYLLISLSLIAIIYQCIVIIISPGQSVSALSAGGGIIVPEFTLFIATNALFFYYFIKKSKLASVKALIFIILPLYALLAALLLYVSLRSQTLSYYFYKLELVTMVALIPFVGVAAYNSLSKAELTTQKRLNGLYILVLYCSLLAMSVPSIFGYNYFVSTMNYARDFVIEHKVIKLINDDVLNKKYGENPKRIYFSYADNKPLSILASNIARIGYHNSQCDNTLTTSAGYGGPKEFAKKIVDCTHEIQDVTIYTDMVGKKVIKSVLTNEYLANKQITITTMDSN